MIQNINSHQNYINFTSKPTNKNKQNKDKPTFEEKGGLLCNALDEISKKWLVDPSVAIYENNMNYYSEVKNLIKGYQEALADFKETSAVSKQNFLKNKMQYNSTKNQAKQALTNGEVIGSTKTFRELNQDSFVKFRKNLTTDTDTVVPSFAVVKNSLENSRTIYDFESGLSIENYNENSSGNSAKSIHVFGTKGSDNIYSKIAKSIGTKITLNNVVEKSKNMVSADSLVIYDEDSKEGLTCREVYFNPTIIYLQTNQQCLIKAPKIITTYNDESIDEFYSDTKALYESGYESCPKRHNGKISVLVNKNAQNYGVYTLKNDNPFFMTRYIKLTD